VDEAMDAVDDGLLLLLLLLLLAEEDDFRAMIYPLELATRTKNKGWISHTKDK
jgi:hypothetical protein